MGLSDRKCGYANFSLENMQMFSLLGANCSVSNCPRHNVHIRSAHAKKKKKPLLHS